MLTQSTVSIRVAGVFCLEIITTDTLHWSALFASICDCLRGNDRIELRFTFALHPVVFIRTLLAFLHNTYVGNGAPRLSDRRAANRKRLDACRCH